MRILLLNYEYPPLGGGAGNATAHIAHEMAALGHTVHVMTSRFKNLPHTEEKDGYTLIRIPAKRAAASQSNSLEMLSFMLSGLLHAPYYQRRLHFEAVIAFFGIPSAPAAALLKLVSGVPYLVSLRGGDVPGFQPYDLKNTHRLTKPLIKALWWGAAEVVANSQGLALLARQTAPKRDIKIIPNGIDTERFSPAPEAVPVGKWMFAGRLVQQKGLHFLIEAVALLTPDERENLHITLVGEGPWREKLRQQAAELDIAHHFDFVGWIDRADIARYYQAHAGFVFPSLDEGMPNAMLEAMACGLPIIASDIAGNQDLLQGNGWLVPPGRPDELAGALRDALQNPARLHQMGQTSRQIAESYSWRKVAEGYLGLLDKHHV